MRIDKKDMDEFIALYKKRFGEDLDFEDAYRKAANLLSLYLAVYDPPWKSTGGKLSDDNEKQYDKEND